MLTPTEITAAVQGVVKLIKSSRYSTPNQKVVVPDFTPTYRLSVEMLEEIKVHAVRGSFPEKIISRRAPNMDDKEYKYIRENYQQVTIPVFMDYLNTITRACSDETVIDYAETDSINEESMKWYCEVILKDSPLKMTLHSYMKQMVLMYKSIDPMGCVVVKPHTIPTAEVEGEQVISGSDRFEPMPYYYPSPMLVGYEDDQYYLFELKERSWVDFGGQRRKTGIIFELYDNENIYRIIQVGKEIDYTFQTTIYYNHQGGIIPVTRMRGLPIREESSGELAYISPFAYCVPLLNDVICDSNQLRSIKAASVFPYKVMVGNTCYNKMVMSNQEILCCEGTGHFFDIGLNKDIICPSCHGSGAYAGLTPMGVMNIKPNDPLGNKIDIPNPAFYYVAPSTETPGFLRTDIEYELNRAREILHLRSKQSLAGTIEGGAVNTTARGDMIDEKALVAFVTPVRDQWKDIYEFVLEWIHFMRYGTEFEGSVILPNSIDVKTDTDYLSEISEYMRLGFPPLVIQATMLNFLRKKFASQRDMAKALDLILRTDRIITMPFEQYSQEVTKGLVAQWEVILHDSAVTFIMNLQMADPGFLDKDTLVQQTALIEAAKQKEREIKQAQAAANQTTVQSVLAQAAARNLPPASGA